MYFARIPIGIVVIVVLAIGGAPGALVGKPKCKLSELFLFLNDLLLQLFKLFKFEIECSFLIVVKLCVPHRIHEACKNLVSSQASEVADIECIVGRDR